MHMAKILLMEIRRIGQRDQARARTATRQRLAPLTTQEALWLATAGGGSFFGRVGSFAEGCELDALVLDDTAIRTPRELSLWERLERYVYLAEEGGRIERKFVAGCEVTL